MIGIHVITVLILKEQKPYHGNNAGSGKYPPFHAHEIFSDEIQQYIVYHDAGDKPFISSSDNLPHIELVACIKVCEYCPCEHAGIDPVYSSLIPIIKSIHPTQEQSISRTEHKQSIAYRTASRKNCELLRVHHIAMHVDDQ